MDKHEKAVATLAEKLRIAKIRKQEFDARKKTIAARQERRNDTRRKILLGAVIQARLDRGATFDGTREGVRALLDADLKKNNDRALFELPPLPSPTSTASAPVAVNPSAGSGAASG